MANIINGDNGSVSGTAGLKSSSDGTGILALQTNGTTAVTVDENQRAAFVAGTAALPAITTTGDTNTGIFFPAADTIAFAEGGVEAMRINSSGQVGIGTNSPDTPLTFAQSVSNKIRLYQGTNWHIGMANYSSINVMELASDAVGEDITFGYGAAGSITRNVTFKGNGNVGIGTASPADNLHVVANTTSENGIRVQNLNASGQSAVQYYNNAGTQKADIWWNNNGSTFNIRTLSTDPMIFSTNNSERMRIDSSGNLLVGTTTGTNARIYIEADASSITPFRINNTQAGTGSGSIAVFRRNGTATGSIDNTGTTTSYVTSSDYRLKNTIAPMTGALAKVAALKPCTYKWNADDSDGEGFIAHELAEICHQAVSGKKDAVDADGNIIPQGIDTSFLVATLTAAIQEQQALITTLTARITALENK